MPQYEDDDLMMLGYDPAELGYDPAELGAPWPRFRARGRSLNPGMQRAALNLLAQRQAQRAAAAASVRSSVGGGIPSNVKALPFSIAATIPAGASTAQATAQPSEGIQAPRMVVDVYDGTAVASAGVADLINDVKVGRASIFLSSTPQPATFFSPQAQGKRYICDNIPARQDVSVSVSTAVAIAAGSSRVFVFQFTGNSL